MSCLRLCKAALWSQGWCSAHKHWGFLLGVRPLWNHFRATLLKNGQFCQETEIVPGLMLWKGEAGEKETPCPLPSTTSEGHSPWFFLLYFPTKFPLLKIQLDSVPVASPWVFYAGYKSFTSLTTLQCCRVQGGERVCAATCLLVKLLSVSSFQISEPPLP